MFLKAFELFQGIDNFYGEKFATEAFDLANSGATGQGRNFKLDLPTLMWHKSNTGVMGESFYVDPDGFDGLNLFQPHYMLSEENDNMNYPGLRYYHLWDTHANADGYPNRVGKVFPDLKMIAIDDEELSAAMSYKSNRNYTLPAPRLGLVVPNTFNQNIAATSGILTGDTETMFVTYRFENTGSTNGLHCNYYSKIAAMPVPSYAKTHKKKINLQITYLQDDKVYYSNFYSNIQTSNADEINDLQDKVKNDLRLIVSDVYKQLNDKSSEYIYLEKHMFILNKKDFLNCQVVIEDIS